MVFVKQITYENSSKINWNELIIGYSKNRRKWTRNRATRLSKGIH